MCLTLLITELSRCCCSSGGGGCQIKQGCFLFASCLFAVVVVVVVVFVLPLTKRCVVILSFDTFSSLPMAFSLCMNFGVTSRL